MTNPVSHDTITIKRTLKAPIENVFAAWANPEARALWGRPSDDEGFKHLETDFRVGGTDIGLCGPKDDLRYRVETKYHDIRSPHTILSTETISTEGSLLSISLISVHFAETGNQVDLTLTIQISSLVGEQMIEGNKAGWPAALDNLARYLNAV